MTIEQLREDVRRALNGADFELSELGLYCHRNGRKETTLKPAEAAMAAYGPVRAFDFAHEMADVAENGVPHDGADIRNYEGIVGPAGHRIFRVDHHYPLASLSTTSSTPLVLQWLRGLWRRGRKDLLAEVARSRYVADHADTDILLSNYAATEALNPEAIHGPLAGWLSAAALRNDYIVLPDAHDEPQASRIFYACVGLEAAILDGSVTFAQAQGSILPQLEPWVTGDGRADPEVTAQLSGWDAQMRAAEESTLARIGAWERAGRLTWRLDGRVALLEAEEKIDNSDLFLYFLRHGRRPTIQALVFPEAGAPGLSTIKLRSHGGFDLQPLFAPLNDRMPGARFGGRAAACGSKPIATVDREGMLQVLRDALEQVGERGRER